MTPDPRLGDDMHLKLVDGVWHVCDEDGPIEGLAHRDHRAAEALRKLVVEVMRECARVAARKLGEGQT